MNVALLVAVEFKLAKIYAKMVFLEILGAVMITNFDSSLVMSNYVLF